MRIKTVIVSTDVNKWIPPVTRIGNVVKLVLFSLKMFVSIDNYVIKFHHRKKFLGDVHSDEKEK